MKRDRILVDLEASKTGEEMQKGDILRKESRQKRDQKIFDLLPGARERRAQIERGAGKETTLATRAVGTGGGGLGKKNTRKKPAKTTH